MYTLTGTYVKLGDKAEKLEDVVANYNALEQKIAELETEKKKRDKEMLEVKTLNAKLVGSATTQKKESMENALTSLFNMMNGLEEVRT